MLYPTELRGQMAMFDYFSAYPELFDRFFVFRASEFRRISFRSKSSDFYRCYFPEQFKKGWVEPSHRRQMPYPVELAVQMGAVYYM